MELPDVPVIQPGGADGVDAGGGLDKVGALTENVACNHDRVVPVSLRKFNNEIHRDRAPTLLRNLGRVQFTDREFPERLSPAAQVASRNVPADVTGQLGPPVVPGDKLQRLEAAGMSGDLGVVVLL
jgi:hypothetical protein